MKYYYLFLLFAFSLTSLYAQQPIQAKLIDSTTQEPIQFATVSLNNKSGVISNENGKFLMLIKRPVTKKDSLFISCLGYETKSIPALKFKDSVLVIKPKSIELNEVLVSNKNYTVEEVIEKAYQNLPINYSSDLIKSKLFYRESHFTNILKHTIAIKKSTIPEFNQKFADSLLTIMPKKSDNYIEVLGILYEHINDQKLDIIKASNLYDKNNEVNFEGLEERFNTIIKKHVKRDSYFKIKSGIFGTKEDIDSSFFNSSEKKAETEKTKAFIEEQKKKGN